MTSSLPFPPNSTFTISKHFTNKQKLIKNQSITINIYQLYQDAINQHWNQSCKAIISEDKLVFLLLPITEKSGRSNLTEILLKLCETRTFVYQIIIDDSLERFITQGIFVLEVFFGNGILSYQPHFTTTINNPYFTSFLQNNKKKKEMGLSKGEKGTYTGKKKSSF